MNIKSTFEKHIFKLQDTICQGLENSDGEGKFEEDNWKRNVLAFSTGTLGKIP